MQAVEPYTFFSREPRTFLLDLVKKNYNLEGEREIVQFCDLKEPRSELGNEYT